MVKKLMRIKSAVISEITNKYNNLLSEAKKIQTEAKSLRVENNEFRIALKEFRTKLVETVVFNSNLTYVVRILEENSTTQAEKKIIRRFDEEVSNRIKKSL
jgi:regulator of replication initiation timing